MAERKGVCVAVFDIQLPEGWFSALTYVYLILNYVGQFWLSDIILKQKPFHVDLRTIITVSCYLVDVVCFYVQRFAEERRYKCCLTRYVMSQWLT